MSLNLKSRTKSKRLCKAVRIKDAAVAGRSAQRAWRLVFDDNFNFWLWLQSMSWTRTHSASSKWVEDVAMASIRNEPGSPKSFSLPLPVTQPSSTHPKVTILEQIGRSKIYSKGAKVARKIKATISAPSSDTVVRQSLGDIQLALDANTNNGLVEEVMSVPVDASDDEVVDEVVVDRSWLNDMSKTSLKSKAESESEDSSADTMLEDIPSSRRYMILVWTEKLHRLWNHFFNPKFLDTHKEETYQR